MSSFVWGNVKAWAVRPTRSSDAAARQEQHDQDDQDDDENSTADVHRSSCSTVFHEPPRTGADVTAPSGCTQVGCRLIAKCRCEDPPSGCDAGDVVLATLARRIQDIVRDGDAVVRLGGDEFVILCDTVTVSEARDIAERARAACREPIRLRGSEVVVDARIGIAITNAKDVPASLLRRADTAVYAAKHAGRGRVALDHNDAAASPRSGRSPVAGRRSPVAVDCLPERAARSGRGTGLTFRVAATGEERLHRRAQT
jgi:diguanylate cyclase with GGDEF domain